MSKGKRSNVVSLRKVKSYRELMKEAGDKASPGLKMMADAEESGALENQLGYTEEGAADRSLPSTSSPPASAKQPAILPPALASSLPQMPGMPPATVASPSTT